MKILISALITLTVLSACSLPIELLVDDTPETTATVMDAASTNTAALPDTQIPPTATSPPDTPLPATEIPPPPTPISLLLDTMTITSISIFSTFGQGETLRSLAFSPDGTVLASAGGNTEDFVIRLWEVESGNTLGTLEGHTSIVWSVAFSPDGQMLASVSNDSTGKIWDWRT